MVAMKIVARIASLVPLLAVAAVVAVVVLEFWSLTASGQTEFQIARGEGTPVAVADRISEDERIRTVVQEGDIERRARLRVVEPGCAKRAVISQGEYDEAVGIWRIRRDHLVCAVGLRDPENR
jgi:hypothetical protein